MGGATTHTSSSGRADALRSPLARTKLFHLLISIDQTGRFVMEHVAISRGWGTNKPGLLRLTCLCLYKEADTRHASRRVNRVMFSGARADSNKNGMEIKEAAALRKQRRIKQGIQFLHKDSADLLPLDGLKKLGTSKEGPHNILQRRLLETSLSRNRLNSLNMKPPYKNIMQNHSVNSRAQDTDDDLFQVTCQCLGREVAVTLDTGCTANLISSVSVEKLGVKEKMISRKAEDDLPVQHNLPVTGHIELSLVIGQLKADLPFSVVEIDRTFMSLGTKTLKSLKCIIDTEKQMLTVGKSEREQINFVGRCENDVSME
ncbi:nuclear receptor-interacting protein 3-like isoform X2 [Brachyhypopomus gauderio]|uniref:nuclear receptor-interacting protein 3-like isoform X2 n=1 Tax=Brachyhypopomus gauderio TaxID=698409 RepID=UPI0040437777